MPSTEVGVRGLQEPGLELLAMGAVVDPFSRCRDPLAGRNSCGMPDHGDEVAVARAPWPAKRKSHSRHCGK